MRTTHRQRRYAALLGALLLVAPFALAQAQQAATTPPPAPPPERVVKVLRVIDATNVASLLGGFNVDVRISDRLGLITLAGPAADVARAEQAAHDIEQLTKRGPTSFGQDLELIAHFLGIVDNASPPPEPLREVVAELKKTFPFQGYKLLETVVLRTRVGDESSISGLLPETLPAGSPPKKYVLRCRVVAIEPRGDSQLVHFNFVRASIRLPISDGTHTTYEDVDINTGLEVPDGKTVVVGKAGSVGESQGYLLVLTAKVVK
jgi:hypothetical protein